MAVVPGLMRRKLVLGTAIALCVVGVVLIGSALIGSEPGPGETAHANTRLIAIGLAVTAVGGLLIGWVTFKPKR